MWGVMTTLVSLRALVRRDLKDEDAANYRWTDDEIDRAIDKALADYSLYRPLQVRTTLPTTADSNEVSLATLSDLIDVLRVEHPITDRPYPSRRFSLWSGALTFLDDYQGDGGNCYVYWLRRHTIGASSTVPAAHEHIVALGAAAHAVSSQAQYHVDLANTGGQKVDNDYGAWSRDMFSRFYQALKSIRTYNPRKIKTANMSTEG